MKVKFKNGSILKCSPPIEQKIFRNTGTENAGAGWVLTFRLLDSITSTQLDALVTAENVETLVFLTENEAGETIESFTLEGYDKLTSSSIRYAENPTSSIAEIQLKKGV